jgi:DNA-binding beta-propeller fold protein YncE
MLKRTGFLLLVLLIVATSSYAQDEKPLIYLGVFDKTIEIVDATTLEKLGDITISTSPDFIELRPDKRIAFVSSSLALTKGLSVVDLEARREITTLFSNEIVNRARIGPDGSVYALLNDSKQIALINAQTFQIEGSIQLSGSPISIIFSPDGGRAYVTTMVNTLLVIDIRNRSVISSIPITDLFSGTGVEQMALSPDGSTLYVGRNARTDSTAVAIVDTKSLSVIGFLPIEGRVFILRISPDGHTLYVEHLVGNLFEELVFLSVVDLFSNKVIRKINVGDDFAQDMKLNSDGRLLYQSVSKTGLLIFDAMTNKLLGRRDYNVSLGEIVLTGNFNLGTPPIIQVLSPQAGETIQRGQPFTIRWQTNSGGFKSSLHQVELSTDSGRTFRTIPASDLPGNIQEFTFTPTENVELAQIRVSVIDIGARSGSGLSGVFSIGERPADQQPPTVRFISPVGGERLISGNTLMINWSSSDNVGVTSQDLSLSTDGGVTFTTTIANGLAGPVQSFAFKIPDNLQTQRARLRLIVRDGANNSAQTITPADFQIQSPPDTQAPSVTISKPMGEIIPAGQPVTVNWKSTDNTGVVLQALLLSLDGGTTFQTITSFGADATSFVLNNVAGLDKTTSRAQVKITATDAAGNKGEQTANFTLAPAITQASYSKPVLTINGVGFTSNNAQATVTVFINDTAVPAARLTSGTNTVITAKGNKKKLKLVKGSNSVRVMVDGISSNTSSFQF